MTYRTACSLRPICRMILFKPTDFFVGRYDGRHQKHRPTIGKNARDGLQETCALNSKAYQVVFELTYPS